MLFRSLRYRVQHSAVDAGLRSCQRRLQRKEVARSLVLSLIHIFGVIFLHSLHGGFLNGLQLFLFRLGGGVLELSLIHI